MKDLEYKQNFPKPSWAKGQLIRYDRGGMVEDLCQKHGVGHPNRAWLASDENREKDGSLKDPGIHGCCGCCRGKGLKND